VSENEVFEKKNKFRKKTAEWGRNCKKKLADRRTGGQVDRWPDG
jgi:hypothetical protein